METDVMRPSPATDFNFDSACTSPYVSSPSSPQHFNNFFFSAPSSPTRGGGATPSSAITGTPKPDADDFEFEDDGFEFEFSGQLDRTSVSAADELFDGGKIKPLIPPPRLQVTDDRPNPPPKSPIRTKILSPRRNRENLDPFEQRNDQKLERERGRERLYDSSASSRRQKGTRSLSPFRVCDIFFPSESSKQKSNSSNWYSTYKKWRLKDLFLFRSASEGTGKDQLKKYALLKKGVEDVRTESFRSTESGGGSVNFRRRAAAVSAHEMHYTAKRAVAEEMRRKTVLPYKHGLLGCLGFTPALHDLSRGLGSLTRG
ncbi:uncharacterized protein LOC130778438 [Actinidia eriantha]|uniref:uncharacterized protein LOC130778438 n=1 Tax=Actinidia eriantha TaxID=165200 RepID=UPI002586D2B2|nr:uncharacterized protein LOC130778438 [Actinidia eriantha]